MAETFPHNFRIFAAETKLSGAAVGTSATGLATARAFEIDARLAPERSLWARPDWGAGNCRFGSDRLSRATGFPRRLLM
jgi:hypothetical protein